MAKKKMTAAEIMEQDNKDFEADVKSMLEEAAPKTPLEAAIDRATGFKPEDAVKTVETDSAETGTEKPDSETGKSDAETEKPETGTKRRDWVDEAYRCFVKDAKDIDPTDPVKAIEAYFQKNATDELKAKCKAEGKDAKGCWKFIEAVARKALHGSNGHIDPGVVYAIAMHWYQDVPKDWDKPAPSPKAKPAKLAKSAKPKKPAETPSEKRKEKERMAKAKAKAKKPRAQQGFFFEMLETTDESEVQNG